MPSYFLHIHPEFAIETSENLKMDDDYVTKEAKRSSLACLHLANRKLAHCIFPDTPQVVVFISSIRV